VLSAIRATTASIGSFPLLSVLILVPHVNPAIQTSTGTIMISTGSSERVACSGDTQTSLGDVDVDGQKVLAGLPVILEVGAVADLDGIINRVEPAPRATRHGVEVLADVADLVAASAVEIEGPEFAGVGTVRWWCARLLCGHLGHSPLWPGGPGLLWTAPGPRLVSTSRIISQLIAFENGF
jgi:ribosome-binding protein aMBF1 (putative translation factor)